MIGNCMRPKDTFDRFDALELSPCINDPADGVQRCQAGEEDFWSIYGCIKDSAEVYALHDANSEDDAAEWLCRASRETGLPVQFACEWFGRLCGSGKPFQPIDLAMALTERIHEDLPDRAAEDFRDDDFENHPLAPIREAMCEASDAMGLRTFKSATSITLYTVTTDDADGTQSYVFVSSADAEEMADKWCRKRWDDDWGAFPDYWSEAYASHIEHGEDCIHVEGHILQLGGLAREIITSAKAQMGDLLEQIDQMHGMFDDADGRIQQAIDDATAWPHVPETAENAQ